MLTANKVISNAMASDPTGTAPWPKGAASVKEIYQDETDTAPVGYAAYVKTDANSANGANWYWYLRASVKLAYFPQDEDGVSADSQGGASVAKAICVSCHLWAGADAAHTPTPGSHDQVYTPVIATTLMPQMP